MKLHASQRALDRLPPVAAALCVCCILALAPPLPGARAADDAFLLKLDLLRMSEMLEVRYYIAEKGELPPSYILLGGLSFYPNPLESRFDLRDEIVEYDGGTGLIYRFRVPRQYAFSRKEERKDLFYSYTPRDFSVPELGIEIESVDNRVAAARANSAREAWLEDVRYSLKKERAERAGKGLLSLDIPIALPKQLERIIGKGEETNLTVQGSERISVSGTSSWCSNCPNTEGRPRQDKFPDLDMEQQLSVSLHGNIGEKINVEIQHASSGEMSQATNKVRLNYRGFDDDVIKLIEMGDTELSLSGAQLVSYSGAAKGLFGVKAVAQTGPLDLTVIASKEEGESASGSFSSQGGQLSKIEIADNDYINRQYFYFENPGRDFLHPKAGFGSVHPVIGDGDDIEVYVSLKTSEINNPNFNDIFHLGRAYPDSSNNGLADDVGTGGFEGKFKRIYQVGTVSAGEGDYEFIQDYGNPNGTRYTGIRLVTPLDDERSLAICYRARNDATETVFVVGDYQRNLEARPATETDRIVMELICPIKEDSHPRTDPTWNMTMRNVYSIGSGYDASASLDVRIEDTTNRAIKYLDPVSNLNYLRIFGLDRYDKSGNKIKDDTFDGIDGVLDLSRGTITFPWYEPFNPPREIIDAFLDAEIPAEQNFVYESLVRDSVLYNSVEETAIGKDHHYSIVVESSSGQRNFQLSAYDILDGSEVVSVDGMKLSRGNDYDIDYTSGIVTLKGDVTNRMGPDSKVTIDYQHKPLLGGGKNSLLGVGANLNLSPNSRISGTFLYNSMGAPKYTPRLGEEPTRTMAADVNGSFVFNPRWMTSLANLLPRVDTNNQSTLNMGAEFAVSIPNPNVKGEAIVDDMEGVEDNDVVSILRRQWYEASPLDFIAYGAWEKCQEFYWYNTMGPDKDNASPLDPYVTSRRDLNPRLLDTENSTVTSLVLDAVNPLPGQWGGIMSGFSGGGLDLSTSQYLEIWVNDFRPDSTQRAGKLHIDFGYIDEDFFQPDSNKLDDEAKAENYYAWTINDDIGFGSNGESGTYTTDFEGFNQWLSDKKVYKGINSRRGNAAHDTEDLNANERLDSTNTYYTLEIDLRGEAAVDIQRDFDRDKYAEYWNENVDGNYYNRDKAWRMYRIDLSQVETVPPLSEPRVDAIQHMRIWIEDPDLLEDQGGTQHPRLLQVAELQFVGNRWEMDGIRDFAGELLPPGEVALGQKLALGTINNKDDPVHYQTPYRVQQEEGIENREQSLRLTFQNFEAGSAFRVLKRFYGTGQNYEQYRDFRFFIFPNNIEPLDETGSLGFYFQIAYDSLNYYEIEVPITPANTSRWTWVNVNFSDLTNLKVDAGDSITEKSIYDSIDPTRVYTARLRGNPTLFQVRYLFAGLRNRTGHLIDRGEVWFNDIKLGDVRRDIDHAERASFSADFAGVLQLNGSWQQTGPEFRSLQQSRGSGATNNSVGVNAKTQIESFIPTARFALPVNFQFSQSNMQPKYVPQSDIEIADDAVRDELRTVNSSYGVNVSMSRRGSTNFIMKNLFDNLRTSFSYSKRSSFTPTSRDTVWSMSGSLNYDLKFSSSRKLDLFKGVRWRYWLSSLTYTSSASRKTQHSYTKSDEEFVPRSFLKDGGWDNSATTLYEPFESVKIDFGVSEHRDLAVKHDLGGIPIGIQTSFGHTLKLNYQPGPSIFILSELSPRFEFKSRYAEDLRPSIRQQRVIEEDSTVFDPFGTRNANAQRDMNLAFNVDVGKYMIKLGEATGLLKKGEMEGPKGPIVSGSRPGISNRDRLLEQLEQSKKPQRSEDAGKIEQLEGEEPPPAPGMPRAGELPPQDRTGEPAGERGGAGGVQDLGVRRIPRGEPGAAEPADTAAAGSVPAPRDSARADSVSGRSYDPLMPVRKFVRLIARVEPVQANINMSHQSQYQRLYDRADVFYQLGLVDEAGVAGMKADEETMPNSASSNLSLDLRSKVSLTSHVGLDVNSSLTLRNSNNLGKKSETKQIVWPSLTVTWSGMEKYRVLGRFLKQSDLRVGFERRKSFELKGDLTSIAITPNWTLEWKNALSSTVGITYKKNSTVKDNKEVWDQSWGANVGLRYNFEGSKGFGLPIPLLNKKKFSFKSTLTTSVNVSYNVQSSYNQPASNALAVSPNVSYRFSNNITGALGVSYRRSAGGRLGYVNQAVEVQLSAEFKF